MPTLDKWYVQEDRDGDVVEPFFKYFRLDTSTMKAQWVRDISDAKQDITWTQSVKWSGLKDTITLVATCAGVDQTQVFGFPIEEYYSNVPYLKSHLQKCIRRSNLALSLKTSLHLARLDFQALIRRLGIIVIEDVQLVPEYCTLIWLTAATSKGYAMNKKQVYWLFGLIAKLAMHPTREPALGAEYDEELGGTPAQPLDLKGWKKWRLYKLDDVHKSIIQSILFRESYGGMTGDKAMLIRAAHNWFNRFNKKDSTACGQDPYLAAFEEDRRKGAVYYISPPEENLEIHEWIVPAVDFHCVNNLIMILVDKYESYEYAEIKEAIWHHSSKWSNKQILPTPRTECHCKNEKKKEIATEKIWSRIRPECYGLATYFLKNNY